MIIYKIPKIMEVAQNQTIAYEIGKLPTTLDQFQYDHSITELSKTTDRKTVASTIMLIAGKYLNANVKGRSISDAFTVELLVNHFFEECGNLELQEIEYIFKSGIMGKYGVIYNDISIDTICGSDGWIEKYYSLDRKKRPEKVQIEKVELSGKEMSIEEFLAAHPDFKQRRDLQDILLKAKTGKLTLDDVKNFYTIKGFCKDKDLKDDMVVISKEYFALSEDIRTSLTENQFMMMEFSNFVIENYNKEKK